MTQETNEATPALSEKAENHWARIWSNVLMSLDALITISVLYLWAVQYVFLFGKKFVNTFLVKKYVVHNVHQLISRTSFFVLLTKLTVHIVMVHMDDHRIYDLTVVYLFKWISNLGPRALYMLQALHRLIPTLPAVV